MKFLSHVYTRASGSIGGITYLHNQHAALVARARVIPTNPQSQNQSRMRASFSTAVNAWRALTQANRDDWEAYAQTLTYQGPVGAYTPTGREVFLGTYGTARYLDVRGLTITPGVTPPTDDGFLTIDNLDMTSGIPVGTGVKVSATNLANEDYILYASISEAKDPSRNYWSGPFNSGTLGEVVLSSPSSGQIEFDGLIDGKKYFARVRAISDAAPHRMSNLFILSAIATTSP